jgi:hypothetical protein
MSNEPSPLARIARTQVREQILTEKRTNNEPQITMAPDEVDALLAALE